MLALPLSPPVSPCTSPRPARRGAAAAALPFFEGDAASRVQALLAKADSDVVGKAEAASRMLRSSEERERRWTQAVAADEQRVQSWSSATVRIDVAQEAEKLVRPGQRSVGVGRCRNRPPTPNCRRCQCSQSHSCCLQVNSFVQVDAQRLVRRLQEEAARSLPASAADQPLRQTATAHGVTASLQTGLQTFTTEGWLPSPTEVYNAVADSAAEARLGAAE